MSADITVVMPAMNREHLIGRALDSVTHQTLRPSAVIVVDDASTDATAAEARHHGATVIELSKNGGSGPARNRAIREATTTWIAFLDSDDSWHPTHIEKTLSRAGDHVLVTSPGAASQGRILGNSTGRQVVLDPLSALTGDLICTSGTLVRREALIAAGLFRPLRRAQDLDMWVRVLEEGSGLALTEPTFTYYLHDEQAILDTDLMRQCYAAIVERSVTRPWFREGDEDRAWAKWHWDDLRAHQRAGRWPAVWAEAKWLGTHPHAWRTTARMLRTRRRARQGQSRRMIAPSS